MTTPVDARLTLPAGGLVDTLDAQRRGVMLGVAALVVTVLIWAGFFLSLRAGARANLAPDELALVRFGPAGLVFLPVLLRQWRRIAAVPLRHLLGILAGSGLPYFLVAGLGMRHAPVSDGATLIPGTLPLFVAAISVLLYGQAWASVKLRALGLIAAGVVLMLLLNHGSGDIWQGYGLFLLGSLMWANFTVSLKQSGLSPWEGAAVISCGSLALLAVWLLLHPPVGLLALPVASLGFHVAVQGLGVGLLSTLCYAFAIARLGAGRAAAAGALTPVVASVLALPLFGEVPTLASLLGMGLIVAGVVLTHRLSR
ncbi:DMT family transporter [Chitinimonas viridis]|uniref:DMT family transporter n=1 Tax=Chitinimonas viridis TaxID=664880 RepID=A0ABT8B230_9NEIS|nr:DMT family transporter [Chitinimonas viridis]MDN3576279.1 DMT family transporter [Chitinimonas viridis]